MFSFSFKTKESHFVPLFAIEDIGIKMWAVPARTTELAGPQGPFSGIVHTYLSFLQSTGLTISKLWMFLDIFLVPYCQIRRKRYKRMYRLCMYVKKFHNFFQSIVPGCLASFILISINISSRNLSAAGLGFPSLEIYHGFWIRESWSFLKSLFCQKGIQGWRKSLLKGEI